jgi:hypothetical protein
MLGWDAYDPEADVRYNTLPYEASDGGHLALDRAGLFDGDQIYRTLRDAGVETHAVVPEQHRESGVRVDATNHYYSGLGDFAATLRRTIDATRHGYVYAYYPGIDRAAHHAGPTSAAHDAQLAALGAALERELRRVDDPGSVVCCLVADHGQVTTPPGNNQLLPDAVTDAVQRDRNDTPVITGGPRNVHLHLYDDTDTTAIRDALEEFDVHVLSKTAALDAQLWGPGDPGPAFERNCGDLVVIPRTISLAWDPTAPVLGFEGMHGGLHPDEALVPFAPIGLADAV